MEERVKHIIAITLGIPVAAIASDASPGTLPAWDSIHHLNLMLALEEALGVVFEEEEISDLMSLQGILSALARKGVPSD